MGASALFRIFFKMESFFRFSLSSTRKTVFSGTRNAVFRKRSPERSFFENAGLSFLCGRTKTEAFENDHVIHVHLSYITVEGKGYYCMSFIISNCPVEGQKRSIRYMCTRILFRKRRIVIFTVWLLAILVSIIAVLFYNYKSFKASTLSWMSFPLSFLFIVCARNISIWRKVRIRNITLQQQNRAAFQNQRLTNALLFVSAISVLSWLPLVIVNYLLFVQGLDIPRRFLFVDIINILNLSNSILNPFVYALRIPEFRQALRVSCCSRRQDVMNRPGIVGRENMAAVLTPVLQRRAIQCNSSQVQQIYGKEVMDTKLCTKILSNVLLMNSKCTIVEKNERH